MRYGMNIQIEGKLHSTDTTTVNVPVINFSRNTALDSICVLVDLAFIRSKLETEKAVILDWLETSKSLPELDTQVLIVMNEKVHLAELRKATPTYEETFHPYRYWDDPNNDGQDWEFNAVTHWKPLPALPKT